MQNVNSYERTISMHEVYMNSFKVRIHDIYELMQKKRQSSHPFFPTETISCAATAAAEAVTTADIVEATATAMEATVGAEASTTSDFFSPNTALKVISPSASFDILTPDAEYAASVVSCNQDTSSCCYINSHCFCCSKIWLNICIHL
jgi:hypothetical protein